MTPPNHSELKPDKYEWTYSVTPSIDFKSGEITLQEIINGVQNQMVKMVCRTQEEATRKALIALGWTPPVDSRQSESNFEKLEEEEEQIEMLQKNLSHCVQCRDVERYEAKKKMIELEAKVKELERQAGLPVTEVESLMREMVHERIDKVKTLEAKLTAQADLIAKAEHALLDAKQVIGSRMNMEAPLGIIQEALDAISDFRKGNV
jgi:hypothetical protein